MKKPHIHHSVPSNLLNEPGSGFIHNSPLQSGLFFSAAAHIFLILTIGFVAPAVFGSKLVDNTLDVVIVNQSNNIENEDAKLTAQSDNAGGGNSEREASSPVPWKAVNPSEVEQLALNANTPLIIENQLEEILAIKGANEVLAPEEQKPEEQKEKQQQDDLDTLQQIRLEKKRIAARYEKRWDDFQKRPKHEYLSPNTKSSKSAAYQAELIEKIEKVGKSNFPTEIRNKNLKGKLVVNLALNRNGTINKISILKSSGNTLLDKTATRFIRLASPFKPFTNEMIKSDTNIINITRSYIFTPNKVYTEAVDPSAG